MVSKGRDASTETSMICPHDHQECDKVVATAVVPVVWTGSGKNKLRPVAG